MPAVTSRAIGSRCLDVHRMAAADCRDLLAGQIHTDQIECNRTLSMSNFETRFLTFFRRALFKKSD